MKNRPDFSQLKSYDEFAKYYWYREELSKICRQLQIDDTGTKQELNHNIKEYFNGNLIQKKRSCAPKRSVKEITLDCPLLDCGFSFNATFRTFFSKQTGIENFKFTADMATAWRKVKQNYDQTFTIQNMLDVYYGKSDYAKYDNSSCEWNQFLKDFCADKRTAQFKNRLKAASILWRAVRDSDLPKVYSYDLIVTYQNLLQKDGETNSD